MSGKLQEIISELKHLNPLLEAYFKVNDQKAGAFLIKEFSRMEKILNDIELEEYRDKNVAEMTRNSIAIIKNQIIQRTFNWKGAIILGAIVGTTFFMGYFTGYFISYV